jgi:CRP-like cAMP-binding protein/CheY-like chemotaxis protein
MEKTILVIEDNLEMGDNISSILELAQYHVLYAPNGKVGVSLAQQEHPDLIICDIMMPELDGYGVRHILSNDPETENIPFIFLTAKADKEDVRVGMNLGADDYITKPFDGTDLLKAIEIRLKKSDAIRNAYKGDMGGIGSFNKDKESRERKQLLENRPTRRFRKKEFVFLDGQTPNELYYVNNGEVKTYRINADGKEFITGFHRDGDFLGFAPILEERPYAETAEVLRDAKITMIPKQPFLTLVYSSRDFARNFIHLLSHQLEEAEGRLIDLAYQSVRQRVASTLLKMANKFRQEGKELIVLPRKEMSNLIGTATESLNRTLSDFKDEGLIEISGTGIKITNRAKLEKLAR